MHFFRLIISFIGSFTISTGGIFFLFRFVHSFDGKIQSESDIYVFASPKCACPPCFGIKVILIERRKEVRSERERERDQTTATTKKKKNCFQSRFRCGELRFFGCSCIYFHFYCLTTRWNYRCLKAHTNTPYLFFVLLLLLSFNLFVNVKTT